MATSVAIETPTIPAILFAPIAIDHLGGDQPATERKLPERRVNLGYAILYSAVFDYMGADVRNHRSAKLLLYPADEHYRQHLQWVCGMTDFSMHYLRATLDMLRPRWDRARQLRKES